MRALIGATLITGDNHVGPGREGAFQDSVAGFILAYDVDRLLRSHHDGEAANGSRCFVSSTLSGPRQFQIDADVSASDFKVEAGS